MKTLKEAREFLSSNKKPYVIISSKELFDEKKEYYMVDYQHVKDCAWVRHPFATSTEISNIQTWAELRSFDKGGNKGLVDFRVIPERLLDRPYELWNEELQCWVPDDLGTRRTYLFDARYEFAVILQTGQLSLMRYTDESKEDWFKRIKSDSRMEYHYEDLDFVDGKFIKINEED